MNLYSADYREDKFYWSSFYIINNKLFYLSLDSLWDKKWTKFSGCGWVRKFSSALICFRYNPAKLINILSDSEASEGFDCGSKWFKYPESKFCEILCLGTCIKVLCPFIHCHKPGYVTVTNIFNFQFSYHYVSIRKFNFIFEVFVRPPTNHKPEYFNLH